MEEDTVIRVKSLSKGYKSKTVLTDLSFSIKKGDFYGILGKNGAGKTTLIECLYGALKPDKGKISVLGMSPFPRNRKLLAEIGIQEQRGAFIYRATAREHLETLARIYNCDLKRVDMLINRMGLKDVQDQRARLLSGGQQQKIALAAAVLNHPKILFLDEPTAALDVEARIDFLQQLQSLQEENTTIVYTTHYLEEAQNLCNMVNIIQNGSTVFEGTPKELIEITRSQTVLSLPYRETDFAFITKCKSVETVSRQNGFALIYTVNEGATLQELASYGVDLTGLVSHPAELQDAFVKISNSKSGENL